MKTITKGLFSSITGFIVTGVTLLTLTGVAFASGGAMFNPGSLNTEVGSPLSGFSSHSEIKECSTCHVSPWSAETMSDRCLQCHEDITAQLQDPTSLHGLISFGESTLNCRTCHTEHKGPAANLTQAPSDWHPHDMLGFSLKAHTQNADGTPFNCENCHVNGYTKPFDQLICANCHLNVDQAFAQQHILTFWTDCRACHDGLDSRGSNFDHNQVPFKLEGVHSQTACTECHINARNLNDLRNTPQDCFSCHADKDEHMGKFGTQCGVCHIPEAWNKVGQFDHNLADFKLTGKHTSVDCKACHINDQYKGTPKDCFSCHANVDKHAGKFGTDCATCHVTDGWANPIDHSKFAFHLDGKHANVACETCHTTPDFKNTPSTCISCHSDDDAHKGQLGTQCGTCHTPTDWSNASFDHNVTAFKLTAHKSTACKDCHVNGYVRPFDQTACVNCHMNIDKIFTQAHVLTFWTNCMSCHDGLDSHGKSFNHNNVAFHLDGKHAGVQCSACHVNARTLSDLKATPQACISCHQKNDIHKGQFGTQCEGCHSPNGWKPAKIDHSKFAFKLDGKHANVACESCHKNNVFKGTPMTCIGCHSANDVHKGQLGTNCAACHTVNGWKPATINHAKFAFRLDGKHATVACASCHINAVFKGTPMTCAGCHTKNDVHKGQLGTNCAACHSVNGWKPASVDHSKFAFRLDGKHANVACASCHINGVYKGTPTTCAGCHTKNDVHKGQLGTNCASCHTVNGWKPATVDHNKFAFRLDGKHASVTCTACHKNGVFKGTPMTCIGCHSANDIHKGQLGTNCAACHSPSGWKPAKVDHSKFAFHLDGKHAAVACASCHINGVYKGTPTTCAGCHTKNDVHSGRLGTNCASCHTVNGWKPSIFNHNNSAFKLTGKHVSVTCAQCHKDKLFKGTPMTCVGCHAGRDAHNGTLGTDCASCHSTSAWKPASFDHNKSAFPLTGKHTSVTCAGCHKNNVFKGTPKDCYSCHAGRDAHNGTLGTNCASCHATSGWKPASFDHNKSAFPLTGKHTGVACASCHKNNVFKGTPKDCYSCHAGRDAHNGTLGTNCAACHATSGWKPATFNHNQSAFPLTGAHASAACARCHVNNVFKGTPTNCFACHAGKDAHNGAFGTSCGSCHSTSAWKPASFDHSKSAFPLTGKHTGVACASCHKNGVYKGTPKDCYSCHAGNDAHNGAYGTNCASCHATSGWKPANFSHSFPLNHGGAGSKCATCHPNNTSSYTCFGCHEHTSSNMASKHKDVKGYAENKCASCHPNGKD